MSERKVINKYIPPNFDPSRIPRRHAKSKQHTVRLMAPFSMRCNSCGEYIYKGRKFNARKETVENERYLTIKIYRFYIRCPQCASEITYRTDPKNADYECELGAKRNFEPWREEKAEEERAKTRRLLEEIHNPMKALENKTYDSKREIDIVEALDELRHANARLERVDTDAIFERIATGDAEWTASLGNRGGEEGEDDYQYEEEQEERRRREQERAADDAIVREAFRNIQRQQEEPAIPTIRTKDLLLETGSNAAKRLTAASLGIVPRKKPPGISNSNNNSS